MTDKERKSCIRTIEFLRGLAFSVHGVMDIIDAQNCDEIIKMLEKQEPQIIRCKDCKHRDTEECPMRYEEWVSFEEDGYIESDNIAHDQTRDDGFCDRGERGEQE